MDVEETPDDDLRDPLTPVDLLLPGAWRTPRPDRRATRRPGDGSPLAPPPPVVRSLSTPSTLPLPLGELADGAPGADAAPPPAVPAALPPLPEWSQAAPPRTVGNRTVLGAAAGLVVVGGVSLWLGLLPVGGSGGSGGSAPPAATSAAADSVVPASAPSTQAPTTGTTPARTPAATRTATSPRTSTSTRRSSSRRAGTVLVDPQRYVGRPARQAQRDLRRLGLNVKVDLMTTGVRRGPTGVVVSVRPAGRVPAGSTVVLVVRA